MQLALIMLVVGALGGVLGPKFLGGGMTKKYTKCVETRDKKIRSAERKAKRACKRKTKKLTKKLKTSDKKVVALRKKQKKDKLTRWGRLDKDKVGRELVKCEKNMETLIKNGRGLIMEYETKLMDTENKHWFCSWCSVREDK